MTSLESPQIIPVAALALGCILGALSIWRKVREAELAHDREMRLREMEHARQMKELEVGRSRQD